MRKTKTQKLERSMSEQLDSEDESEVIVIICFIYNNR